jgi:site-specific DNA-methyltransferase (adenine-specific)
MKFELHHGDCLDVLKTLADCSVDAIVTDPPYGLGKEPDPVKVMAAWVSQGYFEVEGSGFMGKKWDAFVPQPIIWKEVFRVLKPGGHLLAFAGTRTQDWMAMSLRFAGFEIRDMIAWVYGSGFPKSLDVSKAIDKAAGAEREVVGRSENGIAGGTGKHAGQEGAYGFSSEFDLTAPATEAAKQWEGWGTALKPALEPITLARKPLIGTVAANVLEHGTGGLNIDGCRVGDEVRVASYTSLAPCHGNKLGQVGTAEARRGTQCEPVEYTGRWPANFLHDGSEEVLALLGEAARFYYSPKASRDDRDEGLSGFELHEPDHGRGNTAGGLQVSNSKNPRRNIHSTVKPTDLMRYLCRLITPPNGIILDPFTGSGSTGKAAMAEGFRFIGIEREAEYIEIARARISAEAEKPRQLSLF